MTITRAQKAFLFAGLLLTSATHAAAQAVFENLRVGDGPSASLRIGTRTFALPEGEWQLIAKSERNSSAMRDGVTIATMEFQELRNGRLDRLLRVVATMTSRTTTWRDEPCKAKGDSYWLDDRKRSFNDQFCIRVGFETGMVDRASGLDFQNWARGLKQSGIAYSSEMPSVTVTRFTPYDFLSMRMAFNPNVSGIGQSENAARQFNDWNSEIVPTIPMRKDFYDSLVKWAPIFAGGVERAFTGDITLRSSDYSAPKLPPASAK